MQIKIKKALLEGHQPEQIITEAKHAGTPYEKGTPLGTMNRPVLKDAIKNERAGRDANRNRIGQNENDKSISNIVANSQDNNARVMSQTSNPKAKTFKTGYLPGHASMQQPRLYQSMKESYNPITEAVHANHPELSKSKTGTSLGYTKPEIQGNRNKLAERIADRRMIRDKARKLQADRSSSINTTHYMEKANEYRKNGNEADNMARGLSQTGGHFDVKERSKAPNVLQKLMGKDKIYIGSKKDDELFQNKPRSISSAKE